MGKIKKKPLNSQQNSNSLDLIKILFFFCCPLKPSLWFSVLVGVSQDLVEKVRKFGLNRKLQHPTQVIQLPRLFTDCSETIIQVIYGCPLPLQPTCLFAASTATHPPTCLVHCHLASRVYILEQNISSLHRTPNILEG